MAAPSCRRNWELGMSGRREWQSGKLGLASTTYDEVKKASTVRIIDGKVERAWVLDDFTELLN